MIFTRFSFGREEKCLLKFNTDLLVKDLNHYICMEGYYPSMQIDFVSAIYATKHPLHTLADRRLENNISAHAL